MMWFVVICVLGGKKRISMVIVGGRGQGKIYITAVLWEMQFIDEKKCLGYLTMALVGFYLQYLFLQSLTVFFVVVACFCLSHRKTRN